MKIGNRLLLAYLANSLVVLLFGIFAYQGNQQTQSEYQQLNQHSLPILETLNEIQLGAMRVISSTAEAGLIHSLQTGDDEAPPAESEETGNEEQALAEQGERRLRAAAAQYTLLLNHSSAPAFSHSSNRSSNHETNLSIQIEKESEALLQLSKAFFAALENDASSRAQLETKAQLEDAEIRLLQISQQAINHEKAEIEKRTQDVSDAIDQHVQVLFIGVGVIMLIGALMSLSSAKHIATPLARIRDAADRIARGDLSVTVAHRSNDELGQLSRSFNLMTQGLEENKHALEEAFRYTENILHVMDDILLTTDAQGVIQKVNRAACEQLGYSEQQLLGSSVSRLLEQNGKPITAFIPVNKDGHFERNLRNSQGGRVPVLASLNRIDESNTGFLLIATNISARKLAEEKIHKLAYYDALSGLPNRTLFNDRLQQAVKFANRQKHHLAVLFIDIDNFKQINDSLGHDVGDELLRQVSDRLVTLLRESDVISQHEQQLLLPTVSRHGGDEFLVLLPYIAEPLDAGNVAKRIQHQFNQSLRVDTHEIFSSLSIGIAVYPQDGAEGRILIQNADTALYSAKASGKNQFHFFAAEMNSSALRRLDLENNLRRALGNQEFHLYYQPQLSLGTGQVIGMEALIRWHHPEWGVVSPLEFIPIAESSGMILDIGDWVLREACAQWRTWQKQGMTPGKMSVNLSALQFHDNALFEKVQAVIGNDGIEAEALVLEITESVLMQDAESTLSQLRNIQALGVRFAVDDFGTGYSSLSYLKTFPLDYLKIDRAFVRDLESSESDLEIVRTIISMAKNLNLLLIAEGVETPGQLRILQAQECTYMQGFLLSRPIPAHAYQDAFLTPGQPTNEGLKLCNCALQWDNS